MGSFPQARRAFAKERQCSGFGKRGLRLRKRRKRTRTTSIRRESLQKLFRGIPDGLGNRNNRPQRRRQNHLAPSAGGRGNSRGRESALAGSSARFSVRRI